MSGDLGFQGSHLRPGHPDLLDLPWDRPLHDWVGHCQRLEELPRGESRHDVLFVSYGERVYALKALPPGAADREYRVLREMERLKLPAVLAVGHLDVRSTDGDASVLATRYLEYALPYHELFLRSDLSRYRNHLLDAMAGLLVELHLAGVYWGDCSLFNTLFLRDAGMLRACLVDAETSEAHPTLDDRRREHDLDIMEENVAGGLWDLVATGALDESFPAAETAADVRRRYLDLWREVTREEVLGEDERWRIEERIRNLNALGFSVGEMELSRSDEGRRLRMRTMVTDRSFHRDLLHALTGLETQEQQARLLVNEIRQLRVHLAAERRRSVSLAAAAHQWLLETYEPISGQLRQLARAGDDPPELYCDLLEHKWYMSERAQGDVGHEAALADYAAHKGAAGG